MSALGLNIGVFSNLPVIDRISCLSYLFASTNTYEQNTVSVWDLSQDKWCVKARVWDYLKILHGKSVGSTNPVDNINYRISSLEHFFLMGDETEMKDTNFLILNEKKEYTSEESESIVAFSDKIILITQFNEDPESIQLITNLKLEARIELWFYGLKNTDMNGYRSKWAHYFKGRGYEIGQNIPKTAPKPGLFTLFDPIKENNKDIEWEDSLTKLFYHAD